MCKEWKCERCGRTEWESEKIPLQVHHINGDNRDNRIENLQLLCPNCHALTDTYCGKKKKMNLPKKIKGENGTEYYKESSKKICPVCGNEFYGQNKFCSEICYNKYKEIKHNEYLSKIDKVKLIDTFKKYHNFSAVGREFWVSDKTVAKWCKECGLPYKSKDMRNYLNEN